MTNVKFIVELGTCKTIDPESEKECIGTKSNDLRSKIQIDIDTLKELTNYCHWIPLMRGLHLQFIKESFPGWEWNDFIPRLIKKKILQFNGEGNDSLVKLWQGLYISSDIEAVTFTPSKNGVKIELKLRSEVDVK